MSSGHRPVVFLHGGTAGGWMWERQQAELSDRATFAPDVPGYVSRRDEPWNSVDSVADRLASDIEAFADGPVDLVGLSMGGIMSLHMAARHPHLVASALVTGVSVLPYTRTMRISNQLTLALWHQRFYWAGLARTLGLEPEAEREFVAQSPTFTRENAIDQLREIEPGGVTELERIDAPVLAVVGEKEARYFHRSLREIGLRLPGALTGVAPGMHHGWSGEDPSLFNRVMRAWLDDRELHPELLPAR